MSHPSASKGYRAERAVVVWAVEHWEIIGTDRITKGGGSADRVGTSKDRADVRLGHSTPHGIVVQVKDGYTEGRAPSDHLVAKWLADVDEQVGNGQWDIGLLVHKRAGKASPNDWRWYLSGTTFGTVIKRAPLGHMPPYVQLQGYMIPNLLRAYGWLP